MVMQTLGRVRFSLNQSASAWTRVLRALFLNQYISSLTYHNMKKYNDDNHFPLY